MIEHLQFTARVFLALMTIAALLVFVLALVSLRTAPARRPSDDGPGEGGTE